jgi:hypothetical protein
MKNAIFLDVTPCGSGEDRRFGVTYHFHHEGGKSRELETALAVTSNRNTVNYVSSNFILQGYSFKITLL